VERIPFPASVDPKYDHTSLDPKYSIGNKKRFRRSRSNHKRRKGNKRKMDVRLDVVELDMLQDPITDTMNLDLDRDTVEKLKTARFPRLR